jgi:hypothetical protein
MSSGCGIPISVLDEAGNVYEIFVDHIELTYDFDPPCQVEATTKIK